MSGASVARAELPRTVSQSARPQLSGRIFVLTNAQGNLITVAVEPSKKTAQKFFPGNSALARISPDGKRIAASRFEHGKPPRSIDLIVVDRDEKTAPVKIFDGEAFAIGWSRDSAEMLVVKQSSSKEYDLWRVAADGSRKTRLGVDHSKGYGGDWSPDGNWVLAYPELPRRDPHGLPDHSVVLFHPDGTGKRELLASMSPVSGLGGHILAWPGNGRFSPDGKQVYFVHHHFVDDHAEPRSSKSSAVLLLDVKGGKPRRILERTKGDHIEDVLMSPDGKSFVVVIYDKPMVPYQDVHSAHLEILDFEGRLLETIRLPEISKTVDLLDWR